MNHTDDAGARVPFRVTTRNYIRRGWWDNNHQIRYPREAKVEIEIGLDHRFDGVSESAGVGERRWFLDPD